MCMMMIMLLYDAEGCGWKWGEGTGWIFILIWDCKCNGIPIIILKVCWYFQRKMGFHIWLLILIYETYPYGFLFNIISELFKCRGMYILAWKNKNWNKIIKYYLQATCLCTHTRIKYYWVLNLVGTSSDFSHIEWETLAKLENYFPIMILNTSWTNIRRGLPPLHSGASHALFLLPLFMYVSPGCNTEL